jgi:hypothetical protein
LVRSRHSSARAALAAKLVAIAATTAILVLFLLIM